MNSAFAKLGFLCIIGCILYDVPFILKESQLTVTVLQLAGEKESCNCLWSARKPLTSTALVSIQKTLLRDESLIESQPANDSILKQSGQSTHWPLSRITTNASPKHDGIAAVCWNRLLVHGANSALPLPSILQISLGNSSFITKAGTGAAAVIKPWSHGIHTHAYTSCKHFYYKT